MELNVRVDTKTEVIPLPLIVQSLNVLSMDACALDEHVQATLLENPLLEAAPHAGGSDIRDALFAQLTQPSTLRDDLHQQLGCIDLPARTARAADLLIDCLDDDGYLREDLAELAAEWRLPPALLDAALTAVQSLEPTGVGCRSVEECLRLQLLALDPPCAPALEIVDHLTAWAAGEFRPEGCSDEELDEAAALIRTLSPHPCADCGENRAAYIVPDLRVTRTEDGTLCAELINQPAVPVLSPLFHAYLAASTDLEHAYVRSQLDMARGYIRALEMRAQTLSRIAQFLLTAQRDYFLIGPTMQHPLTLSVLAKALGLHVSTVSRAIAGKYVEFSGRVFPLRTLFCGSGIGTLARPAILARIRALLDDDPTLSDSKLAAQLNEQGITISRRTVNKYRNFEKGAHPV